MFSSRIDTTKSMAQAIAASSSPPHSWVLVSGVGKCPDNTTCDLLPVLSRITSTVTLMTFLVSPAACYKPSLTAEYTEDSEWTPFDVLSQLVKEWEASALLPEGVTKNTKQVVIRSGT